MTKQKDATTMSAHTETHGEGRVKRKAHEAQGEAQTTNGDATHSEAHSTQDMQTLGQAAPATMPTKIGDDLTVYLPRRHTAGMVLDDTLALILDTAVARQFKSNWAFQVDARAKALAKLGDMATEADRKRFAPVTEAELHAAWPTYLPNIGGAGDGVGATLEENARAQVATRFWNDLATRHNASIASGGAPLLAKPVPATLYVNAPRKAKDQSEADHKATVEAWQEGKTRTLSKLASHSVYGPQIEALVQADLQARLAEAAAKRAAKASSASATLANDDLF